MGRVIVMFLVGMDGLGVIRLGMIGLSMFIVLFTMRRICMMSCIMRF